MINGSFEVGSTINIFKPHETENVIDVLVMLLRLVTSALRLNTLLFDHAFSTHSCNVPLDLPVLAFGTTMPRLQSILGFSFLELSS